MGAMSTPSMVTFGSLAPVRLVRVGKMSTVAASWGGEGRGVEGEGR